MDFKRVEVGQHFRFANNKYIKVENLQCVSMIMFGTPLHESVNAINLKNGAHFKFVDDDIVELI